MRVHLVSDVHGNFEALARAGEGADALLILGDLLDYVDYRHHDQGILGALFGREKVSVFAKIRREGSLQDLSNYSDELWSELADPAAAVLEVVHTQYKRAFDAINSPTYLIPGNVDIPDFWSDFRSDHVQFSDGKVIDLNGVRFGFVGGGLLDKGAVLDLASPWVPHLRDQADFAASVSSLGPVDVLCSHVPPAFAELTYDTVARRMEAGSPALRDFIVEHQPKWSFFGHVHQPLSSRLRVGKTECHNVGFFKKTEQAHVLMI